MARKIRFPLRMKNDAEVRTLEELRENFDLESVLGYFTDGKLQTWLEDRYYDVEAQKVSELDANSSDLKAQLCAVLGVNYVEDQTDDIDIDVINRRNEKKNILSQLTDNTEALNNIDSVALNQDDLLDCYDLGLSTIYLVGDTVFSIPVSVTNVTYIGLFGAKVKIQATGNVDFNEKNLVFNDISFVGDIRPSAQDNNNRTDVSNSVCVKSVAECDGTNFKELLELAKNGNAEAQYEIGKFLWEQGDYGYGKEWLHKSIDANNSKAMYYCAWRCKGEKGLKNMLKAAMNGFVPAQYLLSRIYGSDAYKYKCSANKELEYEWLETAAKNGHILAQRELGKLLYTGGDAWGKTKDINKIDKAVMWLTKAVENGDKISEEYLKCIKEGKRISLFLEEAEEAVQ